MSTSTRADLLLIGYSHESSLPCELNEVIGCIKRKNVIAPRDENVGLRKDIHVIPLSRGCLLHTKELVFIANTLQPFFQMNGDHTVEELSSTPEMESNLQQLHYHNLLSFGSNNGQLKFTDIPKRYRKLYEEGDFVTFPLVPTTVELDITNACNFRCIHCSRDAKPRKADSGKELSTKELLDIIEECAAIGVLELILMGGEPLYNPDFFKLVKHAKAKGIRDVRTSTNGWFINENIARELSEYFDNIQISIHGASSSTHDHIANKKGAFEQAKKAIRLLRKHNLKINVSFTVMRENISDVSKMPNLVKKWGGDSLRFIRLVKQGRGCLLDAWSEEEITKISNELKKIYQNLPSGLELDVGGFSPLHSIRNNACFYGCSAGRTLLSIASDGKVKVCGSLDNYVGNVREKSILDIWHCHELIEMRRQPDCDCSYRSICYGPCQLEL